MPLIPKLDATNEDSVQAAKEALSAKEATEAKVKQRLADANKLLADRITEATGAAVAVHLADAEEAPGETLAELCEIRDAALARLAASRTEVESLGHAVNAAADNTTSARMQVVRLAHKNSVNRVSRHLEKILGTAVKMEGAIETSADLYKELLRQLETLRGMWPAGELPVLEILSVPGLNQAIERHMFRVSAVIDPYLNIPVSKLPGSRCGDIMIAGRPELIPALSTPVDEARQHLLAVLRGEKDSRSGAVIAQPAEPAIQTGAELENGQLRSAAAATAA